MFKAAAAFFLLLLLFAVSAREETISQEVSSRAPFSLALPDIEGPPITSVEAHIPTTDIRSLKLTVHEPFAGKIGYGSIYTAINGEAANTVCANISSGREGKVLTCNLESNPRFSFQSGKNVIEISATDRDNKLWYASYVLIAGSDKPTPKTLYKAEVPTRFSGRKFAVVIGVSRYQFQDAGLIDLKYADSDARAVRDFLLLPAGGAFKDSDIFYMENSGATTDIVRSTLAKFLRRAAPQDLVFIYIAAHGSPDPFDPRQLYLLLHDTKVANLRGTALGMSELQEMLDHVVRAERVIVLIDACHSAGVSGPKLITGRQLQRRENNVFNLYAARLYRETGRAVLTSSDVNEISEEGERWGGGHGVFTWALLEGLRGAADFNKDQIITAGEVFEYVSLKVRQETDGRQNPRALTGTNSNFPLAQVKGG